METILCVRLVREEHAGIRSVCSILQKLDLKGNILICSEHTLFDGFKGNEQRCILHAARYSIHYSYKGISMGSVGSIAASRCILIMNRVTARHIEQCLLS